MISYFLGANSPQGFYSLYDELIDRSTAKAVYILKGGPGCGKSTLMKKVGAAAEQAGYQVEHILCSGDPASLDAILLPALGIAIVDGTSPHAEEPLGHLVATELRVGRDDGWHQRLTRLLRTLSRTSYQKTQRNCSTKNNP